MVSQTALWWGRHLVIRLVFQLAGWLAVMLVHKWVLGLAYLSGDKLSNNQL